MFVAGAIFLSVALAWAASRANEKDRPSYDGLFEDQKMWILALHTRQDLKLIAFLLGGVIVMLGVVAERIK